MGQYLTVRLTSEPLYTPRERYRQYEDLPVFTPRERYRQYEDLPVFTPRERHRQHEDLLVLNPRERDRQHEDSPYFNPRESDRQIEDRQVFNPRERERQHEDGDVYEGDVNDDDGDDSHDRDIDEGTVEDVREPTGLLFYRTFDGALEKNEKDIDKIEDTNYELKSELLFNPLETAQHNDGSDVEDEGVDDDDDHTSDIDDRNDNEEDDEDVVTESMSVKGYKTSDGVLESAEIDADEIQDKDLNIEFNSEPLLNSFEGTLTYDDVENDDDDDDNDDNEDSDEEVDYNNGDNVHDVSDDNEDDSDYGIYHNDFYQKVYSEEEAEDVLEDIETENSNSDDEVYSSPSNQELERRNVKQVQKSWTFIDDHVRKISDTDEQSFERFIAYLDQPIKSALNRDVYITRAIIYWMFDCEQRSKIRASTEKSPLRLMESLRQGEQTRQQVFKTLCRKGGVPCKVIPGIGKFNGFEPGQTDTSTMRITWNSVWLEGLWWPVYPDGIMQTESEDGLVKRQFDEFWFLTSPEIFIFYCFPDNIDDQMLPTAKEIKTEKKFLKLPMLSPQFFKHNLTLTSEESSILDADEGRCVISFQTDSAAAKRLAFYPKLTMPEAYDEASTCYDPNRLVFCSRKKGHFTFEVRCPTLGHYKIQIRGGMINQLRVEDNVVYTAMIDNYALADGISELPIDTGLIGWGHGPFAEQKGLLKPTVIDPKVRVTNELETHNHERITFEFTLKPELSRMSTFNAALYGGNTLGDYKEDVETKIDADKIRFDAKLRNPGEYALAIYATGNEGAGQSEMICAYLIINEENKEEDESDDSSLDDGFSDIDEENYKLEQEIAELEAQYAELLERAKFAGKMESTSSSA